MNRRVFLALAAAARLPAQRAGGTAAPGAALPPPPAAKITSSVALSSLKGSFQERVMIAAKAGIQSVELGTEYASWDDAAISKARTLVSSFLMGIDAIAALPDMQRTLAVARRLNCRQIYAATVPADLPAGFTALLDNFETVKAADRSSVRLAFTLRPDTLVSALKEVVGLTNVFRVTAPGDPRLKELFQAIGKAGYDRYMVMDFVPPGNPVGSLIQAVDGFRAALADKPLVRSS